MKQSPPPTADDDMALALTALAWILSDEPRATRFLALTGLTPAMLRGALDARSTQAAILAFLTAHENDLVSCAAAIDSDPATLAAAAARLET